MIPETIVTLFPTRPAVPTAEPPPSIPGYEVLEELGRGGMGVVFKARHKALNRLVALKMILAESDIEDRLRFLGEAESVAAIEHPNVVQIHEFGQAEGRPFLVMEFLGGGTLAHHLREFQRLAPHPAAALVSRIARGVQAAHDAGIVHRDLKPANILLAGSPAPEPQFDPSATPTQSSPPRPPAPLVPKVSDFGIAKRSRAFDLTQSGMALGTPAYMAPEQASGQAKALGPPADVHALGVILFECLTGRPPYMGETPEQIMFRVVQHDPPAVRDLAPVVPRDLELICEKCLEKKPAERYQSAAALADDLDRFLAGEPVSVVSLGPVERSVRWVRKHPTRALLYAFVVLTVMFVTFTATAAALWFDAEDQRDTASRARDKAQREERRANDEKAAAEAATAEAGRQRGIADAARADADHVSAVRAVDLAFREYELDNPARARQLLDGCPARFRAWEWHAVNRLVSRQAGVLTEVTLQKAQWLPGRVTVSSDGRFLAIASGGRAEVRDTKSGAVAASQSVAGRAMTDGIRDIAFINADGSRLTLTMEDGTVREWDRTTGMVRAVPSEPAMPPVATAFRGASTTTALSPDRTRAATGGEDGTVRIWDAQSGAELLRMDGHTMPVKGAAFSPDGTRLASVGGEGRVKVWDVRTGFEVLTLRPGQQNPVAVGWSPDGTKLVAVGVNFARILDSAP